MYNIKKAVSRLDFAPKLDDIKVTDIKRGLGIFTPKPDKAASFDALKATLKKAGYTLGSAEIVVVGRLMRDDSGWWIEADVSKQRFDLEGADINILLQGADISTRIEATGDWRTVDKPITHEVIRLRSTTKVAIVNPKPVRSHGKTGFAINDIQVSLEGIENSTTMFLAPIRTTSPGLTVYKGGAVMPRYSYTRQHLGDLEVDRHALRLGISYTPTPMLQVEAEIPYQSTSFETGTGSGSGSGFGNITVWGKYRFFRTLETWGDKQAAFRLGIELPTGKKDSPSAAKISAPAFVRQQLSPINGGLAFHSDVAYSQARHRFIFGANLEGIVRSERDGFRMGNEIHVNTDFEYVLLPLNYRSPGRELFTILETSYTYRSRGRILGREVSGSSASEFHLAPGLQFTATPRLVIEASYQFPVIHNTGPFVLRTDRNLIVGIRYLY